jgi:hypothetical protein
MDNNLIKISKPKVQKEHYISKIKYDTDDFVLQFPKMSIVSFDEKHIELEFIESNFTKKTREYLKTLDEFLIETISLHSEQWFNKKIPVENIKTMYKPFHEDILKFTRNGEEIVNKKDEPVSDIKKGDFLECICQLKFLVFSKDTCFITWELGKGRYHKKIQKVPKFAFIDEPEKESDSEEYSFF